MPFWAQQIASKYEILRFAQDDRKAFRRGLKLQSNKFFAS